MAEPHVSATTDQQPSAKQRPAVQPLHLAAIVSGLALIAAAASNQAVTLSGQLLPAPGIPIVRGLFFLAGGCLTGWGLWAIAGSEVVRLVRRRWQRPQRAAPDVADDVAAATSLRPDVEVRLRGGDPIVVDVNSTVPNVSIWFEVISHYAIDAVLEKIVLQLWAGQPVLSSTMDHRHDIPAHSTVPNVWFSGELTPGAVERIRQEMAKRGPRGKYTVHGTAYFSSINGTFEVQLLNQERQIPPTD